MQPRLEAGEALSWAKICYVWPRLRTPDLVTLGEAFEDLVFLNLERLPRAGEEIKTSDFSRTVGGGAVITAVAASRLGLACRIYSGLSDHAVARLKRERVAVSNMRRDDEPHAISAALSTRSDRSFVTFNGINDRLQPRLLEALPSLRARHVHLAFQPEDCRTWAAAVRGLQRRGLTCSWDFGWSRALGQDRHFPTLLNALDLFFINEQEALLFSRRRTLDAALDVWRSARADVVIKLGRRGSCLVSKREIMRAPATRVSAVDTTGAGDAFNGGFLTGRLRGQSSSLALRLGNFVGAMSTRAAGGLDGLPVAADVDFLELKGSA